MGGCTSRADRQATERFLEKVVHMGLTSIQAHPKVVYMTTTKSTEAIKIDCTKCGGRGRIEAFAGIDNGRCWACAGQGFRVSTEAREERNRKARERRRAKAAAAKAARCKARILAEMAEAQAEGVTLREYHDDVCMCGGYCAETWNGGAMAADWERARTA